MLFINMKEKGSAIYFSLMVLAVVLGIVLGVSSIMISRIRMTREANHSVIAYHAADSGVELALRLLPEFWSAGTLSQRVPSIGTITLTLNGGGTAEFWVRMDRGGTQECARTFYCIRSEGTHQGITRAIEVGN